MNDHPDQSGPITGGCLCGKVRYEVSATPRVHYCHCDMCRRATGSAFAVLAWIPANAVRWTAEKPKSRASSPIAERGFCADCGSPLTLIYPEKALQIALHLGTFDSPDRYAPGYNYGAGQRLSWVGCGRDLPDFETKERW